MCFKIFKGLGQIAAWEHFDLVIGLEGQFSTLTIEL